MSKLASNYKLQSQVDEEVVRACPDPSTFRLGLDIEAIEDSLSDDFYIHDIEIIDIGSVPYRSGWKLTSDIAISTEPCEPHLGLLEKMSDKILRRLEPSLKTIVVDKIKKDINRDFLSYIKSPILTQPEKDQLMSDHIKYMTDRFDSI